MAVMPVIVVPKAPSSYSTPPSRGETQTPVQPGTRSTTEILTPAKNESPAVQIGVCLTIVMMVVVLLWFVTGIMAREQS